MTPCAGREVAVRRRVPVNVVLEASALKSGPPSLAFATHSRCASLGISPSLGHAQSRIRGARHHWTLFSHIICVWFFLFFVPESRRDALLEMRLPDSDLSPEPGLLLLLCALGNNENAQTK